MYQKIPHKLLCAIMAVILLISGCKLNITQNAENKKPRLNTQVQKYLNKLDITQYTVSGEAEFAIKKIDLSTITCSNQEINNQIAIMLDDYGQLKEYKNRKTIRQGDFVTLSLYFTETKECSEKQELKVGAGFYDKNIESKLIGKQRGQTFHTYTDDKIPVDITIEKIQKYVTPELNATFVKKEFECSSINEYKQEVKKQILTEKLTTQMQKEEDAYINDIQKKYIFPIFLKMK